MSRAKTRGHEPGCACGHCVAARRNAKARSTPHPAACACPVCSRRRGQPASASEVRAADLSRRVDALVRVIKRAEGAIRMGRKLVEEVRPGQGQPGKPQRQPGQAIVNHWAEMRAWKAAGSPATWTRWAVDQQAPGDT